MADDSDASGLDSAWKHVAFTSVSDPRFGSFTRTRIERIIAIVVGVGCAVLGGQALIASLGAPREDVGWHPALGLAVFIPLGLMILACFAGRGQRLFAVVFIVVYTGALVVWPVAAAGVPAMPGIEPWPFYLINVGTVAAVLVFPLTGQIVAAAAIPLLWGVVRLAQAQAVAGLVLPVVLDVSFALILAGIMVALGWVFRSMAASVDAARERVVTSYAAAASAAAAEGERATVGALMHDSVLAALIAVERAASDRERMLAVGMARDALTALADAEHGASQSVEGAVATDEIVWRIEASARELGVDVRVGRSGGTVRVPGPVARALTLAAAQALTNAVQHADGVGLRADLVVGGTPARVAVRVTDDGPGFDPDAVPADRLGVRASIVARMAAVGGKATIVSGVGGTTVCLEWAEPAT